MTLTHLQLNTGGLRSPSGVMQFILDNEIDVACLQEIVYPITEESPLKILVEKEGLHYVEGVHFKYLPNNINVGVVLISRFPIIEYTCVYYNTSDFQPKEIGNDDIFGRIINDAATDHFPSSRGLKHSVTPRCILSAIVLCEGEYLRLMTTHFMVSDLCSETEQMFEMSQMIKSLVGHAKDTATIFSADLNIRAQSYSVNTLKEVMTLHTGEITDTLSDDHVAKKKDFPDGLAIDHVFSKKILHKGTEAVQVSFADHKAIVSKFELK